MQTSEASMRTANSTLRKFDCSRQVYLCYHLIIRMTQDEIKINFYGNSDYDAYIMRSDCTKLKKLKNSGYVF